MGAPALGLDTAGNLNALSASAGLVRHQDDAAAATGDETAAEGAGIGPVKGFSALLAGQGQLAPRNDNDPVRRPARRPSP
jgi:hypothetical protein